MIKGSLFSKNSLNNALSSLSTLSSSPLIRLNNLIYQKHFSSVQSKPFYPTKTTTITKPTENRSINNSKKKDNEINNNTDEISDKFKFFKYHLFDRTNEIDKPPKFLIDKIYKATREIFENIKNNEINSVKKKFFSLHTMKIRHYQSLYPIFQKMLETIEETKFDTREDNTQELLKFLIDNGLIQDFVNCYFYSIVNEKQWLCNQFEIVIKQCEFKILNNITNETIKCLLEFRRIDLALSVYQDRFIKYGIGNSKETIFNFSNYFIKKRRYRWALVWGGQRRKDFNPFQNSKTIQQQEKGKNDLNNRSPDNTDHVTFIYQEIYSFIHGEKRDVDKLPYIPIPFDQITDPNKIDEELIREQKRLTKAIKQNNVPQMLNVLQEYFFPNNKIPYYNTLLTALQEIQEHYKNEWAEVYSCFPDYILHMVSTEQPIDLQEGVGFLKYKVMPDEEKLNHVFHRLLRQPDPSYPIRLFYYLTNIDGFKIDSLNVNHFCRYLVVHYSKLFDGNTLNSNNNIGGTEPEKLPTLDQLLTKLSSYLSVENNPNPSYHEFDNLLIYHLVEKFRTLLKLGNLSTEEFEQAHNKLVDFYCNIEFKNNHTFDIGMDIFQFRYPIPPESNFIYWNKLYMNAAAHEASLRIYNDRLIFRLSDSLDSIGLIEKLFSEDSSIWRDILPSTTLKYFSLFKDQPQFILDKFKERDAHNHYYTKELIDFIKFVNSEINDPDITQTLEFISLKNNGSFFYLEKPGDSIYQSEPALNSLQIYTLNRILSTKNYKPSEPLQNI